MTKVSCLRLVLYREAFFSLLQQIMLKNEHICTHVTK
jgi:hypothetical protein